MPYRIDITLVRKAEGNALSDAEVEELERRDLEGIVVEDLNAFAKFFCSRLDNGALLGEEIALLKTYLYYKIKKLEAPDAASTPA